MRERIGWRMAKCPGGEGEGGGGGGGEGAGGEEEVRARMMGRRRVKYLGGKEGAWLGKLKKTLCVVFRVEPGYTWLAWAFM